MNRLKKVLDHFWQRWTRERLLELRNIHRLKSRDPEEQQICVGDVVNIHDDNRTRAAWNLGKVEGVITGRDGAIRGVGVSMILHMLNCSSMFFILIPSCGVMPSCLS